MKTIKVSLVKDMALFNYCGIDATEKLVNTNIIVCNMHDSVEFVTNVIQVGASGYISKDTSSEEVYYAINTVLNGKDHLT